VNESAVPPIGERLRAARVERGVSVRGLARAVDVSASLISQIETGKSSPSVSTLYAITTALQISIEDVFNDPDGPAVPRAARRVPAPAVAGTHGRTDPAQGLAVAESAQFTASGIDSSAGSAARQGLQMLAAKRRVGPVVRGARCCTWTPESPGSCSASYRTRTWTFCASRTRRAAARRAPGC
jgi:transcriptional regulator with XRE-family HTH domain